jgi:hypothetical protein
MNRLLLAAVLTAPIASAQDMIAVSWSGGVYALDSYTGTTTFLGTGMFGQNALARDDQGGLWSTERSTGQTGSVYSLTSIDPGTGAATVITPNFPDVRAFASAGGTLLWAISNTSPDQLITIDVTTSQVTTIGPTGYTAVQCLAAVDGVLYAWDNNFGLLTIDPSTGAATDVDPAVGGNSDMQWLARRSDGQLVGGQNGLYEIDPSTGVATQIGSGLIDTRGAEPYQQHVQNFGSGCAGAFGTVSASATIGAGPNPLLTTSSTNHAAGVPGLILVGLSSQQTAGVPLPIDVDPIFGTQGCSLYVSLDVSVLAVTSAQGPATLDTAFPILPGWAGYSLLLQHATLDPVQGGLSLSDAVAVQFGF